MNDNLIGIFIPRDHYESVKKGSVSSSYQQFELAANTLGLSICFFTANGFLDSKDVKMLTMNLSNNSYSESKACLPKVIYNRSSLRNKKTREILNYFIENGSYVFNVTPISNSKYYVNQLLEKESHIAMHLPQTLFGSKKNLRKLMDQFDCLFIKPCYSSVGKGILYLERHKKLGWFISEKSANNKGWGKSEFTNLEKIRIERLFQHRQFIIQEKIPLATYKNRPFDLRVIIQKNSTGHWAITGTAAKLAPKNQLITNVGSGGEFGDLRQFLLASNLSYPEVEQKVHTLALDVASALEKNWPNIADLGLDIGITEEGKPYFIECNLRGKYGSFEKRKELFTLWKNIHHTPIAYAGYLLEKYNQKVMKLNKQDS